MQVVKVKWKKDVLIPKENWICRKGTTSEKVLTEKMVKQFKKTHKDYEHEEYKLISIKKISKKDLDKMRL